MLTTLTALSTLPAARTSTATGAPAVAREWEGDCPNAHCQGGPYLLNDAKQLPEHHRALHLGTAKSGRCPCSGWQARNVRVRPFFYVEGVRWA